MTNVSIITIGDELLIGQVIDTNSAWMAQQLNMAGIRVKRRVAVADIWDEIWQALDEESMQADVILITGGLGPTADDITKPLLSKYFEGKLVVDEGALQNVQYLFEKVFRRELTLRNIKQAEVPDTCIVIPNKRGTAPGMLFRKNGKIFVSMPGVPYEMQGMMTDEVIPLLQKEFGSAHIEHRTLITFGIGESMLADRIQTFEEALPVDVRLAYLPNYGMVRLRLTANGTHHEKIKALIDQQFEQLQELVKEFLITTEDEPMGTIVGKLLQQKNKTLSTAESCTGGYIAHLITSLPGSSHFFEGGVVTYSNRLKHELLSVSENQFIDEGAVSEQVVLSMLKGVLEKLDTDYAIAVSGIMGPDGGTEEKPVGTVWIAVGTRQKQTTRKCHFRFDRQRNIQMTAVNALNLVRAFIIEDTA